MRNMSFTLTTDQIRDRTKTVTRRIGWRSLKPGDLVRAVVKCMGLRPGEKIEPLAVLRVVNVRREKLSLIEEGQQPHVEVRREGFDLAPWRFVEMFCQHMGCNPGTVVTRIEFRYVPGSTALLAAVDDKVKMLVTNHLKHHFQKSSRFCRYVVDAPFPIPIMETRRGPLNPSKEPEMLPEILRHLINNFGRWTLIKASELHDEGIPMNAICGDLGLDDDVIENCVQAGTILRRMNAEQKAFEDRIIEPAYESFS